MICDGSDNGAPETITNNVSKTGVLMGVYAQDEWKITNQLIMNAGLRFDQMYQYVDANQLSPRLSFTYKPFENTTFHAGYARYFTPPVLAEAAPPNIALFNNTTGAVSGQSDPVLPERSIISMRASIKRSSSDAPQMEKTVPISISASTLITRSQRT
jgi:outer membrane receptor protein involved in Fe transport